MNCVRIRLEIEIIIDNLHPFSGYANFKRGPISAITISGKTISAGTMILVVILMEPFGLNFKPSRYSM